MKISGAVLTMQNNCSILGVLFAEQIQPKENSNMKLNENISFDAYQRQTASNRFERMNWFRAARYGLFIHYGLYSQLGRGEWVQVEEDIEPDEYAKLAHTFAPKEGCCREWARMAKDAGMKYMVLTTRHHEGFSLWNSKVNPFNSMNFGPKRDIVREFVDACREYDLKIGLYSSLTDWHHPDCYRAAYDDDARKRFTQYLYDLNEELLTNYGKIDLLWFDGPWPMATYEAWDSVRRNAHLRSIQPDLLINGRCAMNEDFITPEGAIQADKNAWEACMTFNGFSWGYVDENQAMAHAHKPMQIVKMLQQCASSGGNLLLNIGPTPDGSVPKDAIEPLRSVGHWLQHNAAAVYGEKRRSVGLTQPMPDELSSFGGNAVSTATADKTHVYIWNYIWPNNGQMVLSGYLDAPKAIRLLATGEALDFKWDRGRIIIKNLPAEIPDKILGVTVIDMEFEKTPRYLPTGSYYGLFYRGDNRFFEELGIECNK